MGDFSGLKLDKDKTYSASEIYFFEAQNILKASLDYWGGVPNKKSASLDTDFFLKLHKEMFGNVWDWAGKIRTVELNFGVKAYLVSTELKKLADDLNFWHENKTFSTIEISARLHHRAVAIHPFINGNGRWSRMLANIYLKQSITSSLPIALYSHLLIIGLTFSTISSFVAPKYICSISYFPSEII
jgi:Fic-DOC domain mobile mystery protein B